LLDRLVKRGLKKDELEKAFNDWKTAI
jgi:hypothetical protein